MKQHNTLSFYRLLNNPEVRAAYRLNVRAEPSVSAPVLHVLKPNEKVNVVSIVGRKGDYHWGRVQLPNVSGYVALEFLYEGFDFRSPVSDSDYVDLKEWSVINPFLNKYLLRRVDGSGVINFHTGIDFVRVAKSSIGSPIFAVESGEVVFAADGGGTWIGLVVLHHARGAGVSITSRYGHLDLQKLKVSRGMTVKRGELLGYIADPSKRAGFPAHLHFDISRLNEKFFTKNPTQWFGGRADLVQRYHQDPKPFFRYG